ncbi:restriction endonuclease subunit S [Pasteurella atlantica]|uniref:Restriction endonuclease subunit S n=2 Tax=Pasteurellaceae TaxID=712 RepID=A0ACC6HJG1_9PAST|nr:restriction endonuclease subunit S [Pasteurella atlantica]MDP8050884.1 restriction endonuclease subunit S [Pasteurella atlantica]MDP8101704.1 restriction endonuclease subunit S [Pasteurella atlantica]MDP8104154.1 restriction endonuclease subunit S [Pasteurella atlantica]MDP8147540.1 restriction endonuclease subunit S [Pasteurella atlantica]
MNRLQRYNAYKESGIEWLGEIPEHWETKKVKHLFNIGRGRVISLEELKDGGLYPVYSSQTQNDGILGYIETYDFDCEQLTWTTDGANAGTVFLREGKHNCTNVCGTLQPIEKEIILEYLKYTLQNNTIFYKRPDTNGAKIMNNEMADILLTYPLLTEQKQIANFLDAKTQKIDTAIKQKKELITLLKEQKQAIINNAVTKGLDKNVTLKESGIEWLGEIPEHWEVRKLKYLALSVSEKIESNNSDFQYIGMENIESFSGKIITNNLEVEGLSNMFNQGDVLFGKLRPYLAKVYLCEEQGICSTEFLVYRAINILNSFLKFVMLSNNFITLVNASTYGTKMPRANADFVNNQQIPLPPLEEQKQIANFIEKKTAYIDNAITLQQEYIEKLKEYKTSLIDSVVTGKVRVCDE